MMVLKNKLKDNFVWLVALALGITAFVVFVFIHFDGYKENPSVVTIRYVDNISEAQKILIQRFNKEYQGRIRVQAVNLPFTKFSTNDRKEILARALRNKSDQIDVVAIDVIWGARFAKWALSLKEFNNIESLSRFLPQALTPCFVHDTLIALPLYIDVTVMYYRQDLLRCLPGGAAFEKRLINGTTWRDFKEFMRSNDTGVHPQYLYAAKDFEGLVCNFFEVIPERQINFLERSKNIDLNKPDFINGINHLLSFRRTKSIPDSAAYFDEYECYLWGIKHNVLFIKGWPGLLKHTAGNLVPGALKKVFKIAPVPRLSGQKKSAVFGGWNLMISRFSTHKQQALTFLRYIQRVQSQKILFTASGYIPTSRTVYNDSIFLARYPQLMFYRRQIALGKHRPYRADYTRLSDILAFYLHQAFTGEKTADEALRLATQQINANSIFIK